MAQTPNRSTVLHLPQGDIAIDDSMVVEPESFIPAGEYNPHNVHPWIIGHEFGAFAVVFASNAQDAIDIAIDAGKMDSMKVADDELAAMSQDEIDEAGYLSGGNADEYFHQDYLWMEEIPNPKFSFVALLS